MAKKKMSFDESATVFVEQMKQAGVTEKTIKKVLEEIYDYQQKQYAILIKEMFKNIKEKILEEE